ncbi:membrane protein insertase YidC [Luteibacter pinisoli]|jgi:YidC/Oxa1 family membrane protein insertase|uniref:Membrane protein insertase YidC n=1 Tax=Luteibacter pinisoli TaxID=2589080 RepID=A0A4Y5Z930_9GAMM|nr:membrane protein insertase YidC [Luteibacter pinisoli]QDE41476.1 membrane protein insertase YidC [Luteibacter pinisoli]
MNQTRTLLFFALMFVAYVLWTQWEQDYGPKPPAQATPAAQVDGKPAADSSVPGAAGPANVPSDTAAPAGKAELVTLQNDVLRLTIDTRGGSIVRSELLYYPSAPVTRKDPTPPPARLLDDNATMFFAAQDGLVSNNGAAPDHRALFHAEKTEAKLADGEKSVSLDLTWSDPSGVKVTKRYTLKRMDYVVDLDQRIDNGSQATWSGNAYQQLQRAPAEKVNWFKSYTDPAQHSFFGAGWYSPESKFEPLPFTDFAKKPLSHAVTGGWISMLQHYFFVAWIPPADQNVTYTSTIVDPNSATPRYLVRAFGPAIQVAPGQVSDSVARLYIGPKLQGTLDAIAPGLDLTANYGWLTIIATPLHWLLSQLHAISGNWGVAIILLVLLIKAALFKLTDAQFRSGARMRKLQPRVQALKERYGDDRMKMQQAMMELYKKEKVNPMAGCLPILITFPIFIGLLRVLSESIELRHAPFFGWIHDLSAPDPFYVLPVLYFLVTLLTQRMMPTAGMDPTQAKMMKVMPLIFGVFFAFFPSGLVLYWTVNGATSLLQQWWINRSVDKAHEKARTA